MKCASTLTAPGAGQAQYPHSIDRESEAWSGDTACLRSGREPLAELRPSPILNCQITLLLHPGCVRSPELLSSPVRRPLVLCAFSVGRLTWIMLHPGTLTDTAHLSMFSHWHSSTQHLPLSWKCPQGGFLPLPAIGRSFSIGASGRRHSPPPDVTGLPT